MAGLAVMLATVAAASCSLEVGGTIEAPGGLDATADGAGDDAIATGDGDIGDAGNADAPIEAGPCPAPGLPLCDNTVCGAGAACSPPLAPGWSLVVLHRGAAATCPPAFVPKDAGLVEFKAGVPACSCSCIKSGGACATGGGGAATLTYGDNTCPTAAATAPIAPDNGCAPLDNVQPATATFGFRLVRATLTPATCASVTVATVPPADGGAARLCEVSDASALCAQHRFCVPTTTDKVCIAKSGNETCPAPFVQVNLGSDITGTRACSCSCTAANGPCIGTATIYNGSNTCNGTPVEVPYDGGCVPVVGPAGANYKDIRIPADASAGGSCTPVTTPQNTAAAVNPTTVCCTP